MLVWRGCSFKTSGASLHSNCQEGTDVTAGDGSGALDELRASDSQRSDGSSRAPTPSSPSARTWLELPDR